MTERDLELHMIGKVTQFLSGDGDQSYEAVIAIDVVDTDDGEIELAFDSGRPKRRTYIRMNITDLRRVLKGIKP